MPKERPDPLVYNKDGSFRTAPLTKQEKAQIEQKNTEAKYSSDHTCTMVAIAVSDDGSVTQRQCRQCYRIE